MQIRFCGGMSKMHFVWVATLLFDSYTKLLLKWNLWREYSNGQQDRRYIFILFFAFLRRVKTNFPRHACLALLAPFGPEKNACSAGRRTTPSMIRVWWDQLACARLSDSIVAAYWKTGKAKQRRSLLGKRGGFSPQLPRVFAFFLLNDFSAPSWSLDQARDQPALTCA